MNRNISYLPSETIVMKKTGFTLLSTVAAVAMLHSFRASQNGSIGGSIMPQDGATLIWAIQNTDTLRATPLNGQFNFVAKVGSWKVVVDAKDPWKDVMFENVQVNEGKNTSLGEIRLER